MGTEDKPLLLEVSDRAQLLTPRQAGVQLGGASINHVYRLIAIGELRAVDISLPGSRKSKTRVRSDDLQAYIEKRTTADKSA